MASPTKSSKTPEITNAQQLEAVLQQLLLPNNQAIKQAEKILQKFTKKEECIPALMQQIQGAVNPAIRQLAGVILRIKTKSHWENLNSAHKDGMKKALLQIMLKEPEPSVRNAVIAAICEVATFEVPNNNWNELAAFLVQSIKQGTPAIRESGMVLFAGLFESVPDQMRRNLGQLVPLLMNGLSDQVNNVRYATLRAVQAIVPRLGDEKEAELIYKLIPPIINIIKECLEAGNESIATETFQIFDELVELRTTSFNQYIPNLVAFMLEVAKNTKLQDSTRDKALSFCGWVVAYKRNLLTSQKLIEPILSTIFMMLLEEEDEDSDENTVFDSACQLLDEMSLSLPSKHIFKPVIEYASKQVQSEEPLRKKAGITAIGILAEGCNEPVKNNLKQIMNIVIGGCNDKNAVVREAACLALGNMSQFLQPEILDYYEQVIAAVLKTLGDSSFRVKEKACYTLDTFLPFMGEKVIPYVETILRGLLELLAKGDKKTQELVIPTIANVANATQKAFVPYVETIMKMMKQIMESTNRDLLKLRARATECVGIVAIAIGRENIAPYLEPFMSLAFAGLKIDHAELREMTYSFFGNIAQTLEEDFQKFLPLIVQTVIDSANSEDGIIERSKGIGSNLNLDDSEDEEDGEYEDDDEESKQAKNRLLQEAAIDDEEEEMLELKGLGVNVKTPFIDEKASAILAIGAFAKACKGGFAQYLEITFKLFQDLYNYFHYDIRRAIMAAIRELPHAIPNPAQNQQQLQALLNEILAIYVTAMIEDEDKESVARACEGISYLCKQFGKRAVEKQVEDLGKIILLILQQRAQCNQNDVDDEDNDHDMVLIDAVSDCIDDVAKVMGPSFEPIFKTLFPELVKYAKPSRAADDRVMAIGSMAEVSNAIQTAVIPYAPQILQIVIPALKDTNYNIRRNSAFCVGVLSVYAKEQTAPHITQILQNLYPIFSNKTESAVLDNACGAVARILNTHTSVPVDQVLPVFLSALPLREDYEESEPVFTFILGLLAKGNPVAAKNMSTIIAVFAKVLAPSYSKNISQSLQARIVAAVQHLKKSNAQQLQQIISTLPSELQQVLSRIP